MEEIYLTTLAGIIVLMQHWEDMLSQDGINSKKIVREQMKNVKDVIESFFLYEEIKKIKKEEK